MLLTPIRKLIAAGALGCLACAATSMFVGCSDDDPVAPTGDGGGGTDGPVSNVDGGPTSNACADAGPPARTCTAKACTEQNGGNPSVCVEDKCVKLKTDDCPFVTGALGDDNALVVGSLFDLSGTDKLSGGFRQNSMELAVNEINTAGGVPTADGCGQRPLVYVSCDDAKAADAGTPLIGGRRAAAYHLATELKVAGIVGPQNSNNTVEISTSVTNMFKTLMIAPTAGASEITTIDGGTQDGTRVLYRLVPSDLLQGKAISTYGQKVATEIGKTTLKAAIVNRGDTFGNGLRDAVKANFVLNGKPWGDAANAANVAEATYPAAGATAANYTTALDTLAALQPDIVFWFGLGEITPNIIVPYERDRNPTTKPIWLSTTSGQRNELINALNSDAAFKATAIQTRIKGTSAQVTTSLSQDFFNFRYKAKYPEPKTLVFGQTQAYDGTYLIAFASAAAKPGYGPLLSIDVAKGMHSLVGGTEVINVGPTKVKSGFETLRKGGKIDFNGASGPHDFDVNVGEAQNDYAIWCVRTDPNTSTPVFENVTGMTWKYGTNTLEGTYSCPQN
jgi:ABC-type branched-subunit amino acid transport system substrate-binding protein